MDQTFIELLDIDDIYQQKVMEDRIDIYFTMHRTPFRMILELNEEKNFYPSRIVHNERGTQYCGMCGKKTFTFKEPFYTTCLVFDDHYDEMFQRLIEHPSIRLEWLYIPHVEV